MFDELAVHAAPVVKRGPAQIWQDEAGGGRGDDGVHLLGQRLGQGFGRRAVLVGPLADRTEGLGAVDLAVGVRGDVAMQAALGANLRFTPSPNYWVTAGAYVQGEELDVQELGNEAEIPFNGTLSMRATLDPDLTWTVSPAQA